MILAFSSLAGYGLVSPICTLIPGNQGQNIVVYEKRAKKKANVTSYLLMASEWHPCSIKILSITFCLLLPRDQTGIEKVNVSISWGFFLAVTLK